ncbi:hypothetical protein LEMLEM_LOCUS12982 [Lemmus lemmus]
METAGTQQRWERSQMLLVHRQCQQLGCILEKLPDTAGFFCVGLLQPGMLSLEEEGGRASLPWQCRIGLHVGHSGNLRTPRAEWLDPEHLAFKFSGGCQDGTPSSLNDCAG